MQFNETLVKLRKEQGYTQEQLAEKLSVSRQAVARWEAGETAPDVYILQKMCEIFGVSADGMLNAAYAEPQPVQEQEVPKKHESSARIKILCIAAIAAIVIMTVLAATANIGVLMLAKSQMIGEMGEHFKKSDITLNNPSIVSSLSYAPESSFWTAEEYEKWSEEQLEYYRNMYESGEKMFFYTESGEGEYRALTDEDIESIEKSLDDTLKSIIDGNLYTKDDNIIWTAPDGHSYSVIKADAYCLGDDMECTEFGSDTSDIFLTYDGNVATNEESTAEGNSGNGGRSYEERFSQYKEYGLEYEEKDGERKLYLNGTPVNKFYDISPDGGVFVFCSDGGGEINVGTVYGDSGELTGLETS